jgi:hypothetical protein
MALHARRVLVGAAVLGALAWSYGAAAFLIADGSLTWSMPVREPHPAEAHNLVSYRYGPTLRASSFHRHDVYHHHPAFLVDERQGPTGVEKWCSGTRDAGPWIELSWDRPRQLSQVKIWHAGAFELAVHTVQRYRLSCLNARRPAPSLEITSNTSAVATHALVCPEAHGLRIDWTPNVPGERVRVYEVEAWGQ